MRLARRGLIAAAVAATTTMPGPAVAADYPPATDPGKGPKAVKKGGTLRVCKKGCRYKKIQSAIDAAGPGTTIRVARGTYREGLKIVTARKDRLRLIGDPKHPGRVILDGNGLRGAAARNGVQVRGADKVTVNGFTARNHKGNGFLVARADGYKLTNLVADSTGAHGLSAVNSKGGEMANSEAFYTNGSGVFVGQTPPQTRPRRTTLRNLVVWGNVIGYSGTNSRYVTVTRSKFFNNGAGIVLDVLASRKHMPHENNAIVGNDVFWNNFNYHAAAPFKLPRSAAGTPYPVGTGILLFGGRTTRVESNRIWGNWLIGYGQVSQFLLEGRQRTLGLLEANEVRDNTLGLDGGVDRNGRDMLYDGSGGSNCFERNALQSANVPADNSTFAACGQPNTYDEGARRQVVDWVADRTHEAHWIKSGHRPIEGVEPLERWTAGHPRPRGDLSPGP